MKATLVYSVNCNCVRIACKEDIDFSPLVDAVIDRFADDCNDNGQFQGSLEFLVHECEQLAYRHFDYIDWTIELDEDRNK